MLSFACFAQYVGLSATQISKLKDYVKTNADAQKEYNKLSKIAEAALKQEPNPTDTIWSEGLLANNPKKLKTQQCLQDVKKIYALAMVYAINDKAVYKNKAIAYLTAWAALNKPQGNSINDTKLEELLEGYNLLKSEFDTEQKKLM